PCPSRSHGAPTSTPRWNRGCLSFLVAAFADEIDSDVQDAVPLEDLVGRLLRALLDPLQQFRIGDFLAFCYETADFFQVRLRRWLVESSHGGPPGINLSENGSVR